MSTAIKKCGFCDFQGFVYARKAHCPSCKAKNALTNQHEELVKSKERKCECGCGETVVSPKRYRSGHNFQKNPDLIYRDGKGYKNITCTECKEVFERRADKKSKYSLCLKCSHKQNGQNRVGTILKNRRGHNLTCKVCQKNYYVTPFRSNSIFCSKKCQAVWQREQPLPKGFVTSADNRGEKNGRYKHGNRVGGHVSKIKVRTAVIERDGNWCLKCGKPGPGLHLHRIVYGSQGGIYEVDNCVLLCNVHHEEVHSSKQKWMPLLFSHVHNKKAELRGG